MGESVKTVITQFILGPHPQGASCLHIVASDARPKSATFMEMLMHSADLMQADLEIDARDAGNHTPLHLAASCGNTEGIRMLLEHGASLDAESARGMTPLHYAVEKGSLPAVVTLLDAGADVNSNCGSFSARSIALHIAAGCGHIKVLEELLDRGADANAQNDARETSLFYAIGAPDRAADAVEILLDAGTDVHWREEVESNTVLHAVAESEDRFCPRVFGLLVERAGVDVNQGNDSQRTALHVACLYHNEPMVDALMKAGADETAVAVDMGTPANHACFQVFNEFDEMERLVNWPHGTPEEDRPLFEPGIHIARRIHHRLSQGPQDRENIRATKAWRRRGWLVMLRIRRRWRIAVANAAAAAAAAASAQAACFDSAAAEQRGCSTLAVLTNTQEIGVDNSERPPASDSDEALAELSRIQLDERSLGIEPAAVFVRTTEASATAKDEGAAATENDGSKDKAGGNALLLGVVDMLTAKWEQEDLFREIVMFL